MKIKSILSALLLMISSVASAQYLNVKLEDGTCHSYKTTPNMKVSFGDKAGADVTESEQIVTVNGHTVTVKFADDTPASDVMVSAYMEDGTIKIRTASVDGYGLGCSRDDNVEVLTPAISNGFYTFTLSDISKDMVVTVGYITVSFDINNSGKNGNFTAKPEDITKIGYNVTISEPRRLFSEKYGFRGWYTDKECTEAWNFSTGVTRSMTLYAKWAEDPTGTQINGHDFVKLGGYYWATVNIGEVKDQNNKNMDMDNDGTYGYYYNYENAIEAAGTWNSGSGGGRTWVLPSPAQWQALIDYCECEWQEKYNNTKMNGILVKGRDDTFESGNSVFLPAAGYYDLYYFHDQGKCGDYWSSTADGSYDACYLYFFSGSQYVSCNNRSRGYSVRAVLAEE